jgi:hypothetical protein
MTGYLAMNGPYRRMKAEKMQGEVARTLRNDMEILGAV